MYLWRFYPISYFILHALYTIRYILARLRINISIYNNISIYIRYILYSPSRVVPTLVISNRLSPSLIIVSRGWGQLITIVHLDYCFDSVFTMHVRSGLFCYDTVIFVWFFFTTLPSRLPGNYNRRARVDADIPGTQMHVSSFAQEPSGRRVTAFYTINEWNVRRFSRSISRYRTLLVSIYGRGSDYGTRRRFCLV